LDHEWQSGQHVSLNAFQRGEIGEPALSHGQVRTTSSKAPP
jgi:hypothetical protein